MRITHASVQRLDLRLSEPYTIAYDIIEHAPNIILTIHTDAGIDGWGVAAPDVHVTGESPEDILQAAREIILPFLSGRDPLRITYLIYELKQLLGLRPSTLAMVDMALYDIMARKAEIPLYKLLGGFRDRIPTSVTIGILPVKETIGMAETWIKRGFSILKIKGGHSVEDDIEKIVELRKRVGEEIVLRFDGNQGYTPEEAIYFIQSIQDRGIELELFEQPTRKDQDALLGRVTEGVTVPVMADESLKSLNDVFRLARYELIDMINIKLMKTGGITEALHINAVATAAGLEAMVGCMDECALGISAGLHFALSRPNLLYADLDGHLDLIDDPFEGLFELHNGMLIPSEKPGLGPVRFS